MKLKNALKNRNYGGRNKRFTNIALALLLPLSFSFSTAHAQEAIPATGGDASGDKTAISMAGYVRATYFLKIIDHQKRIKVFKIIKN